MPAIRVGSVPRRSANALSAMAIAAVALVLLGIIIELYRVTMGLMMEVSGQSELVVSVQILTAPLIIICVEKAQHDRGWYATATVLMLIMLVFCL